MSKIKRITSVCAVHNGVFDIGDNDKVFFEIKGVTRTVCVPCQNKIRNLEICSICKKPRNKQSIKTIKLVDSKKFQRVCIWCIKRLRKKMVKLHLTAIIKKEI